MTTDPFVQQLRASLDLEALHSRIEPEAALVAGRRAARRHAVGTAAAGVLAVAAVGVGALTLPGLAATSTVPPVASASVASSSPTTATTTPPLADIADGVTAATGVAAIGDRWTSGLTYATREVGLAPATDADLEEAAAASGTAVDRGLRVVLVPDSGLTPVVAWSATRDASPLPPHTRLPLAVMTFMAEAGESDPPAVTRLLAGVVPPWLPDARVVLFTTGTMRVADAAVHAVEIPTFADPTGSGARVYLAVAGAEVGLSGSSRGGVFLVSTDGTYLDVDGTCTRAPQLCTTPRPDGVDLTAELQAALGR